MIKSSQDASTVVKKGGTTHALEVMYTRYDRKIFSRGYIKGIADMFWHHIVSQPKALRNRLKIVRTVLREKIIDLINNHKGSNHRVIFVLSIAGGSSRSIIYAINDLKNCGVNHQINIVTIDKDKSALEVGMGVAKEYGLQNNFEWINGNARDIEQLLPQKKFDIIEIVGLLDYFESDRLIRLLNLSYRIMNEKGFLIIANVIPNNEYKFVQKTGWPKMYYRKPEELLELLRVSGFKYKNDIIIEPLNVHCIAIAQKQ
ncbi:MAG TPA: class I SAM-dependent methyltransferase family protein [Candidatus Paceibacterota bacterium]